LLQHKAQDFEKYALLATRHSIKTAKHYQSIT
jgi:hypothetical protein